MEVSKNLTITLALAVPAGLLLAEETLARVNPGEFERETTVTFPGDSSSERIPPENSVLGRPPADTHRLVLPRMEFSDIRVTPPRLESSGKLSAPEEQIMVEDSDQVIYYQTWN